MRVQKKKKPDQNIHDFDWKTNALSLDILTESNFFGGFFFLQNRQSKVNEKQFSFSKYKIFDYVEVTSNLNIQIFLAGHPNGKKNV